METKKKSEEMECLRSRWCYDNNFTVDCMGRGGGLALLWMKKAEVEVLSFFRNHIDARVGESNGSA